MNKQQRKCPYCHEQANYYAEPITGDFNDIGCGLINADGDWIATGIDGEHWCIANDIFHKTYERCD